MNAVAMFLQQMQLPLKHDESGKFLEDGEKHALFQSILEESLTSGMLNHEQEPGREGQENKEEGKNPSAMPLTLLTADEGLEKVLTPLPDPEWMNDVSITKVPENAEQPLLPSDVSNMSGMTEDMGQLVLPPEYQSLINIFREVQTVLVQLTGEPANAKQAAPELLQLLQQWVKTTNQSADQKGMEKALASFREGDTKTHMIWKDILHAFEKRQQLASKQQYSTNAHVTTADIAKWLDKAMVQVQAPEKITTRHMYTSSALPMSRMEQYVVYLNQDQSLKAQGRQLTDQFQSIMKSSNFMTTSNNGNQLMLSLRPENLGEMMIRFTQINGEMTVKILVTTQAAKEMLETNMHQLRNMFSPQQVIVERQDTLMQQGQETEKSLKDEQMDKQQDRESNQSSEEENQQSDDDFAARFEALLMNEEV